MYKLICQKSAEFYLPKWLCSAAFFNLFIVLGLYNFEADKNKQKVVTSYITQKLLDFITMLSGRPLTEGLWQYISPKMEATQMEIFNFQQLTRNR
jgi:hypothetical protein